MQVRASYRETKKIKDMKLFCINRGSEQKTKQRFPAQCQALGRPPIAQHAMPVQRKDGVALSCTLKAHSLNFALTPPAMPKILSEASAGFVDSESLCAEDWARDSTNYEGGSVQITACPTFS